MEKKKQKHHYLLYQNEHHSHNKNKNKNKNSSLIVQIYRNTLEASLFSTLKSMNLNKINTHHDGHVS